MNQKLCPVCNTVNTNTNKCVNCGNMFELPPAAPVITSNVLENMPIASTIPISTGNNLAPPLSSLQNEINPVVQAPTVVAQPITPIQQVISTPVVPVSVNPVPVTPVNVNPAPVTVPPVSNQPVQNGNSQILPQMQALLGQEPTLSKPVVENVSINKTVSNFNVFKYIISAFVKPYDTFKNSVDELAKPKNNFLIALILISGMTIFGLLGNMISAVRVSSFFSSDITWVWSNLKKVEYIKLIFTYLFMYASIIYGVSGVYFLAGLILKKNVNYIKLSSVVVTAIIPFAFIRILMGGISWFLPILLTLLLYVFSLIYTTISFIELNNDQINIENKNNRIYFNFSCISILFILALLVIKIMASI